MSSFSISKGMKVENLIPFLSPKFGELGIWPYGKNETKRKWIKNNMNKQQNISIGREISSRKLNANYSPKCPFCLT